MEHLYQLVKLYGEAFGPSGYEKFVIQLFHERHKKYPFDFSRDHLGSLILKSKDYDLSKKTILFTAHSDEIGFIISEITKNGLIKFGPLGGWWSHVLPGKQVKIYARNVDKFFIGIIGSKPIHLLSIEERQKLQPLKSMFIDIGCKTKEQVLSLGISIGDPITKHYQSFLMENNLVCTKSIDNRVGVAILEEVIKNTHNLTSDFNFVYSLSVQEEVGLRGAKTMTNAIKPDIAIVIDTTATDDTSVLNSNNDTQLDKGVTISIMDSYFIANPRLVHYFINLAKKHNIPYNIDPSVSGGTDAGSIHLKNQGIFTISLHIPSRYLHTHNEVCSLHDVKSMIDLITKFAQEFKNADFEDLKNIWV
ncbi:M42 family metallopeptidase [symbiont of Argiope bruennichi]|uniref:M42 family metallopeptidase n=1 Tax=symbiont of Argiope bruennichi TaxID=2810479 RepID=UPI003DA3F89E